MYGQAENLKVLPPAKQDLRYNYIVPAGPGVGHTLLINSALCSFAVGSYELMHVAPTCCNARADIEQSKEEAACTKIKFKKPNLSAKQT